MDLINAAKRIEDYQAAIKRLMPYQTRTDFEAHTIMVGAGIEALTMVDGDELLFKNCLEEAKKLSPTSNRIIDTEHAYYFSNILRSLAYLTKTQLP